MRSPRKGRIINAMFDKPATPETFRRSSQSLTTENLATHIRKNGPSARTVTESPCITSEPFSQWKVAAGQVSEDEHFSVVFAMISGSGIGSTVRLAGHANNTHTRHNTIQYNTIIQYKNICNAHNGRIGGAGSRWWQLGNEVKKLKGCSKIKCYY